MKLSLSASLAGVIALVSSLAVDAYHIPSPSTNNAAAATTTTSRREIFQRTAAVAFAGVATSFAGFSSANAAVDACPKGSNNCIRTTWTPPAGTSPSQAAQAVMDVLKSYPQEGQSDVDKGGWKVVQDFDGSNSIARVEFTSGIGNFAKFLNGGKPFVDDVLFEVSSSDSSVDVRSSSRVGDSDFGDNQKRLLFFVNALTAKGWTAPKPTY